MTLTTTGMETTLAFLNAGRVHVVAGELLDLLQLLVILGVFLQQAVEVAHGVTGALLGAHKGRSCQQEGQKR